MGIIYSSFSIVNDLKNYMTGKKRKRIEFEDEDVAKVIDLALHTPKRKKLTSTPLYIYKTLYEHGQDSDIVVSALGEEFHLHKIYVCQSPYFASMFGGSWKETGENFIHIDVVDPLITVQSLKVVFGSLYHNELVLNPVEIVPILATSTMFQLDDLIDKCTEVMLETINPKTSLDYYNAAYQYGNKKLQDVCFKWFLVNLMTYYFVNPTKGLKNVPIWLMKKLIKHSDLFVLQTEFSIYVMLKIWMYIKTQEEDVNIDSPMNKEVINAFYSCRTDEVPFLLSEEGRRFANTFMCLRLSHLMTHPADIELLVQDNIIPSSWFSPVIMQHWNNVLRINQNEDTGPEHVSDNIFLNSCFRCGRILQTSERHIWRWTGFHFGIDLNMIADGTSISIRRNHRPDGEQLLTFQTVRKLVIRIAVAQLNELRQIVYFKHTDIQKVNLAKNEETQILTLDANLVYPIIISANILYTSPSEQVAHQDDIVQSVY